MMRANQELISTTVPDTWPALNDHKESDNEIQMTWFNIQATKTIAEVTWQEFRTQLAKIEAQAGHGG
jgi:beta-xylosidase